MLDLYKELRQVHNYSCLKSLRMMPFLYIFGQYRVNWKFFLLKWLGYYE